MSNKGDSPADLIEMENGEKHDMDAPRCLLTALVSEVILLRRELSIFNAIFANKIRARHLFDTGPHVMGVLQRALSRDITLQIVRLLDMADPPAKGGPRKNRTLWALDELLDKNSEKHKDWHSALTDLDAVVKKNFRTGRNRVIAHSDERAASGKEPVSPPPDEMFQITVDQLECVLTLAWIMVNETGHPWSFAQVDIEHEVSLVFTSAALRGPQR